MKWFTHPRVIPNLYDFLSSVEHKRILKNAGEQTFWVLIDFHCIDRMFWVDYPFKSAGIWCLDNEKAC